MAEDAAAGLPLRRRIKHILEEEIRSGEHPVGQLLPSEAELMARFAASRHVVRQALGELAKEGIIRTERGRGSLPSPPRIDEPIDHLVAHATRRAHTAGSRTLRVIRNRLIEAPSAELQEQLAVGPREPVVELVRVAYVDTLPAQILTAFLPAGVGAEVPMLDMAATSLYDHLEAERGVRPARAINRIETAFANGEQSELLHIGVGTAMLLVDGTVYDQNDRIIEWSRIHYRADRFRLVLESRS